MKTVREQVLEYIEAHRSSTAEEIARAFKMTGANARHHLSVLMAEGAVEVSGVIQDGTPGRPRQRYIPSRQVRRHNLDRLAHALLTEKEGAGAFLERLADQLWAQDILGNPNETAATSPEHLSRRLSRTVRSLNRMNYDARWEAHAQAPRLVFNHCPYSAIIEKHPELCQMDILLLQKALKLPVTQQIKLGRDADGLPYCLFVVGGKG